MGPIGPSLTVIDPLGFLSTVIYAADGPEIQIHKCGYMVVATMTKNCFMAYVDISHEPLSLDLSGIKVENFRLPC